MSENERLYEERQERINEKFNIVDLRINNHAERIDKLEQYQSRAEMQIENLCEQIKSLVSTMKWAMGLTVTTLLGFLFWYIQNL